MTLISFCSVSVIEPGPVQTSFNANVGANNTGSLSTDVGPDVDELTQQLMKASLAGLRKRMATMVCLFLIGGNIYYT